jgi:putative peptidoglycan lipid II flippase
MLVTMIWIPGLGAGAFGLSNAITFMINACLLIYLLRRRLGLFGGRRVLASVVRSIIASAVMAAVVYLLRAVLNGVPDWIIVAICVPAGAVVFLATAWLLGAAEIAELFKRAASDGERPPSSNVI